jgi:hypothetical protein
MSCERHKKTAEHSPAARNLRRAADPLYEHQGYSGGTRRAKKRVHSAQADPVNTALSRPAHQRVPTPAARDTAFANASRQAINDASFFAIDRKGGPQ